MGRMLDELWNRAAPATEVFDGGHMATLPEPARRYLEHAITRGTSLASAARLRMHGEIKLGRWRRFHAEQVTHADRGFVWYATVPLVGVPLIRGFDRLVDGAGEMRWKLLGIVPVKTASGPDVTRSAVGRLEAESLWLPSTLVRTGVKWTARDARHATATFRDSNTVDFTINERGRLESIRLQRWGNPGGGAFRSVDFGAVIEEERTFEGYTVPTRVRVGWYFGSSQFDADGEFFRATVNQATFR
jgi:hypothetical protein